METAHLRDSLFTILASIFLQPPDAALVEALWPFLSEMAASDSDNRLPPDVQSVQEAFTRHLVVAGREYVPPYASVYLDAQPHAKPLLWGKEAVCLQSEYEAAGLHLAPGGIRVPDHLGIELQFMAYLCRCEAEAWQKGDTLQAQAWRARQENFAHQHLLTWLPAFSARLRQVNAHAFYRLAVTFLEKILCSEISLQIIDVQGNQ